jgi:hypothetical protein
MWELTSSFLFALLLLITIPIILTQYRALSNSRRLNKDLSTENYELDKENMELKSTHKVIMHRIHDIKEKFETHGKEIEERFKKQGGE